MRISDWSSDVCSSDLEPDLPAQQPEPAVDVAGVDVEELVDDAEIIHAGSLLRRPGRWLRVGIHAGLRRNPRPAIPEEALAHRQGGRDAQLLAGMRPILPALAPDLLQTLRIAREDKIGRESCRKGLVRKCRSRWMPSP